MDIEQIKQACRLFVENFPGRITMFLFGSKVRKDELDLELDEVFGSDIDLLFEIDPGLFSKYAQICYEKGVDFTNGEPIDPMDYYWQYHSSKKIRFEAIAKTLGIDIMLSEKIFEAFKGNALDILTLPFGWQENEQLLEWINDEDPNFSASLQKDAILLFEKKGGQHHVNHQTIEHQIPGFGR